MTWRRVVLVVFALGATGCRAHPRGDAALPLLDGVEVAGCAAIVAGPVCRVKDSRELRVVLGGEPRAVAIGTEAGPLAPLPASVADDGLYAIAVPKGATRLTVDADVAGTLRRFAMRLADAPVRPAWLDEALAARARGALDEATRVLDAHATDGSIDADIASFRARTVLSGGDVERAITLLDQSAEMHAARGELSAAVDDEAARANLAVVDVFRFDEGRAALARMTALSRDYPEGKALATSTEGTLALEVGDVHQALARLDAARAHAERLGFRRLARDSIQSYAVVLSSVGRVEEAREAISRIERNDWAAMSPCERGDLRVAEGWYALLARDAPSGSGAAIPDPEIPLGEADAIYAGVCANAQFRANALVNVAWARLQGGDTAGARAALAKARSLVPSLEPLIALFALDLDGRIALEIGDPRAALTAFETLAARAAGVSRFDEARAAEGRSDALARLGDRTGALASIERAEAMLDDAARGVRLGEGRGAFWWARARVTQRRVGLLLDAGRAAEALDAVRETRARIAADVQRVTGARALDPATQARWEAALAEYRRGRDGLAERAETDWSLSGEALTRTVASRRALDVELRTRLDDVARDLFPVTPRVLAPLARDEGTLALAWYPLGDSWAAFRVARGEVIATRVVAPTDEAHAAQTAGLLLASATDAIAHARRLRVLAFDALRDVDIHALPPPGSADGAEPLLGQLPVEYVLDARDASLGAPAGPALVVADPTGTLPAARREGERIATSLDGGSAPRVLFGADATRAKVLAELGGASTLFYSGHAAYAGVDGWDSALLVAGGGRLAIADLLALPRAPDLVVLAGCETGREGERGGVVGLGLAEAFIASGSRAVLASTRKVRDADAEGLMRALVPALAATPGDPVMALRRAELELRRVDPSADWSAFRAFTR